MLYRGSVREAVTFDYCWLSCEDVLIGQNHETIDPLWTSFDGKGLLSKPVSIALELEERYSNSVLVCD